MRQDPSDAVARAVRTALSASTNEAVETALRCVEPSDLAAFFHASLAAAPESSPVATGLPASPGAASGRIVLTADDALAAADSGVPAILVRPETTPDDVLGMQVAAGILTSRGGMVSHAAVVARGWGVPAVVGAGDVHVDGDELTIGDTALRAGDEITIDGSSGDVHLGALPTTGVEAPDELETLLGWADTVAAGRVQVRANADTAGDATVGRRLGAQGIGLCRTEHMFLAGDRLPIMRRFILSDDPAIEAAALAELETAQVADFESVLLAMDGLPVTVRLLDPPLHEFLPDIADLTARDARNELDDGQRAELAAARRLHEANPMIGTRGVRLGIVRSGVYEMQVRALCTAAANLFERGRQPHVEIMIPLVVDAEELRIARSWVTGLLDELGHPELAVGVVTVGAMIETPRAALTAGALAEHADFFSFGTNDLTQMTYAFSRDDVEAKLLPAYQACGILPANPFEVLDQEGVGELVRMASEAARGAKPAVKLGACGEHAGHPASADFLVRVGVDSVSCSPLRVPLARLAVAQALLDCGRVAVDDVTFAFTASGAVSGVAAGASTESAGHAVQIDRALVLHTLRVRGFVTSDGFVASLGDHPAAILDELVHDGLARYVEARDMYALMPAGKEQHTALLPTIAGDAVAAVTAHYDRFLELNDTLKSLCTRWQVRSDVPNDHTDHEYDAQCIRALASLADEVRPVVDAMAAGLPRLARYGSRLSAASGRVSAGDTTGFTGVMCESFHDVWMELHEDLILLQGIDRTSEGSF
ncbi:MAG: PEP-utilizing enzyme [Ilumatobacter sp.]|uniref:putative PEP-binding protein n=1 Tax=Ilumatobacter sp. TaxID=1967498 RepID=UPI00263530FC|nr:putative PEP-binding protein [Ilumatobacter sp.]MDJ0767600.1 PEP-utilizing enzyme [Ilumatobacter sp.]